MSTVPHTDDLPRVAFRDTNRAMTCFVYVLGSAGKTRYLTYVGWTLDVERRLAQHNNGTGARSTRGRAWVLLHVEQFATKQEAMSREWHLKRDRTFRKSLVRRAAAATNISTPHSGADC